METIPWSAFERVELRVGTVLAADPFPEARRPAWKLRIDFGPELGERKSSARLTELYRAEDLVGRQVLAVVNLAPKQIGPLRSECLVTGLPDDTGSVVLVGPERPVPNGSRLY